MHRSLRPIGLIAAITACLALVSTLAPDVGLADDEEYGQPGLYAMFHAVGGLDVDRRFAENQTRGGGGFNTRIGSRESERLAWEFEFEWLIFDGVSDGVWTYGINGKFYFSEARLQPYLVLGANGMTRKHQNRSGHATDWGFRSGLGADYYLNEKWALNLETSYIAGVGDLLRREYASFGLGVLYKF